jgi:hypothetical protein
MSLEKIKHVRTKNFYIALQCSIVEWRNVHHRISHFSHSRPSRFFVFMFLPYPPLFKAPTHVIIIQEVILLLRYIVQTWNSCSNIVWVARKLLFKSKSEIPVEGDNQFFEIDEVVDNFQIPIQKFKWVKKLEKNVGLSKQESLWSGWNIFLENKVLWVLHLGYFHVISREMFWIFLWWLWRGFLWWLKRFFSEKVCWKNW